MTKLDRILNLVVARQREVTLDVHELTEDEKQRVIDTIEQHGLSAASDSKFILVRDLREG